MGLIAALLPAPVCRARLHAAVHGAHTVRECEDWVTLTRACETEPVHLAVFDLYSEGRPSFDQVRMLRQRFPRVGLLCYVTLTADRAREMFDLARCGVDDLVALDADDGAVALRGHVDKAEARSAAAVVRPLVGEFPALVRDAVLAAVTRAHERLTADSLARRLATTRVELTRALVAAGLPAPFQLLTWGRLVVAAHLLEETDRSAEGVAAILEFASPGAFRNACRRYLKATPQEVRARGGALYVTGLLLAGSGAPGAKGVSEGPGSGQGSVSRPLRRVLA
jgi:AraC-like DNA-binding protein